MYNFCFKLKVQQNMYIQMNILWLKYDHVGYKMLKSCLSPLSGFSCLAPLFRQCPFSAGSW
jgi:hypothetical protein